MNKRPAESVGPLQKKNQSFWSKIRKTSDTSDTTPKTDTCSHQPTSEAILQKIEDVHTRSCLPIDRRLQNTSALYLYMKTNGFLVNKAPTINGDGKRVPKELPPPHPIRWTTFDGLTARFPHSAWPMVHAKRAQDIEMGRALFCNEIAQSAESFKMYLELDYVCKTDRLPDNDNFLSHVKICQQVLWRYFESEITVDKDSFLGVWVMISNRKPKYTSSQIRPAVKVGLHLVFPCIQVNSEQAIQILNSIRLSIETEFPQDILDWGQFVDSSSVRATTASLRPLGCRKLEDCPACWNQEDQRLRCES